MNVPLRKPKSPQHATVASVERLSKALASVYEGEALDWLPLELAEALDRAGFTVTTVVDAQLASSVRTMPTVQESARAWAEVAEQVSQDQADGAALRRLRQARGDEAIALLWSKDGEWTCHAGVLPSPRGSTVAEAVNGALKR